MKARNHHDYSVCYFRSFELAVVTGMTEKVFEDSPYLLLVGKQ
jgi:hypothetical protein